MLQEDIVAAVLAFAALIATICIVGVLRSRNNFAALHCAGAAGILVPLLALCAVIIRIPAGQSTLQMALVFLALIASTPIVSHVIGVAEYRRRSRQ